MNPWERRDTTLNPAHSYRQAHGPAGPLGRTVPGDRGPRPLTNAKTRGTLDEMKGKETW
jgi:hypothetical protein